MEKINIKDARIISALKSGMPELYDGVFIMFHSKNDNYPLMVRPSKWISCQENGEVADGVVIVEGGKIIVISPTESSDLPWSSVPLNAGGANYVDLSAAINDWDGKSSTAIQSSKVECSGLNYAPGFCNLYSRVNVNGKGLTAGKWWLPSLGEIALIFASISKINFALSLINGSTQLSTSATYHTSTEYGFGFAWMIQFTNGYSYGIRKEGGRAKARPVSSFTV